MLCDRELLPGETVCPICGGRRFEAVAQVRDVAPATETDEVLAPPSPRHDVKWLGFLWRLVRINVAAMIVFAMVVLVSYGAWKSAWFVGAAVAVFVFAPAIIAVLLLDTVGIITAIVSIHRKIHPNVRLLLLGVSLPPVISVYLKLLFSSNR